MLRVYLQKYFLYLLSYIAQSMESTLLTVIRVGYLNNNRIEMSKEVLRDEPDLGTMYTNKR